MLSATLRPLVHTATKLMRSTPRVVTTPGSSHAWSSVLTRPYASAAASASAPSATSAAAAHAVPPGGFLKRLRVGLRSDGAKTALAGWAAFSSTHLILSHDPVRTRLIALAGSEGRFRAAYSAIAIAITAATLLRFLRTPVAQRGPVMHSLARDRMSPSYALMTALKAAGAFCVVDAVTTPVPNPLSYAAELKAGAARQQEREEVNDHPVAYGMQRVTRHSLFMGLGLFSLGAMLSSRRLPEMLLWAGNPIFGAVGAWHQEQRLRKTKPAEFFEQTSFMPFRAVLDGRQSLSQVAAEVPAAPYVVALAVAVLAYVM